MVENKQYRFRFNINYHLLDRPKHIIGLNYVPRFFHSQRLYMSMSSHPFIITKELCKLF